MKILPVNRSFYRLAILFCILLIPFTLYEATVRFQLGVMMFTLESYRNWFLIGCLTTIVLSLFLLKYYYYKNYRFTYYAGLIDLVAFLWFSYVVYNLLMGEARNYYLPSMIVTFITGIIYGISLVVSPAGKQPWLKTGGFLFLIFELFLSGVFIWSMTAQDVHRFEVGEKIIQWLMVVAILTTIPFIMNFLRELKTLKQDTMEASPPILEGILGIVGILLFISGIILGGKINTEKYWLGQWVNRGPERAIALAKPFEARSYVNSKGDTLKYRLLAPLNYDATQTYPLAVCLHGGGGRGTDNITQIEGSWTAQLLSEYRNREKYPAFIFVPQCSPASSWGGGLTGLSVVDEIVFETIDQLEKEFPIDKKRRYVMGESLGGYGTWHFITSRPTMFAAAVPICGGGDPSLANAITDVPVWAFHGAKDRSVPVRLSRDMITAIKDAGGNPKYTEYPDKGHIISEQVNTTPGLLDWVFEQRRD